MPKKILIKIQDIEKQYKNNNKIVNALNGVSLNIYQGEVFGLLGVNGAGKTTLSSIIATLHPPTKGDIIFNGKSIYKDINNYRLNLGYCPQKPNLIQDLTVEQNLLFAGRYFAMSKKKIKSKIEELVEQYGLAQYLKFKPSNLSGGYVHRVLIARSLMHSPKLLILDEPTVGLDPYVRHQLWENIRDLQDKGITVILTTHYLDEAEILSDRICVLDKGAVCLVDTPGKLKTAYQMSRLEDVFLKLIHEETEVEEDEEE